MKHLNQNASYLSLVRDNWIPKKISDIRGLYETDNQITIFVPHLTKDGHLLTLDKASVDPLLLELWKAERNKLCDRLVPANKIIPEETLWHSPSPLPNHETCIGKVQSLIHAKKQGYENLGDCWLIKFCSTGRTTYVPIAELYRKRQTPLALLLNQ